MTYILRSPHTSAYIGDAEGNYLDGTRWLIYFVYFLKKNMVRCDASPLTASAIWNFGGKCHLNDIIILSFTLAASISIFSETVARGDIKRFSVIQFENGRQRPMSNNDASKNVLCFLLIYLHVSVTSPLLGTPQRLLRNKNTEPSGCGWQTNTRSAFTVNTSEKDAKIDSLSYNWIPCNKLIK